MKCINVSNAFLVGTLHHLWQVSAFNHEMHITSLTLDTHTNATTEWYTIQYIPGLCVRLLRQHLHRMMTTMIRISKTPAPMAIPINSIVVQNDMNVIFWAWYSLPPIRSWKEVHTFNINWRGCVCKTLLPWETISTDCRLVADVSNIVRVLILAQPNFSGNRWK